MGNPKKNLARHDPTFPPSPCHVYLCPLGGGGAVWATVGSMSVWRGPLGYQPAHPPPPRPTLSMTMAALRYGYVTLLQIWLTYGTGLLYGITTVQLWYSTSMAELLSRSTVAVWLHFYIAIGVPRCSREIEYTVYTIYEGKLIP
ncbi:hypothetical protein XENTR_v10007727 [Xenopus tropicalis]|nr:hypothetical protein XENTR_v10007727 [Xenopus tropicalis]